MESLNCCSLPAWLCKKPAIGSVNRCNSSINNQWHIDTIFWAPNTFTEFIYIKRGFCDQIGFLICIPPPLKVPQRPHVHPPLVESLRRPVTTASASTGWPLLSSTSYLKSTCNDQTPHPPNADPASATVAATAAMAATRLVAERTTFVNPTSTRWAPMANRQTDIEYQMGNKRTSNKWLRSIWAPCVI